MKSSVSLRDHIVDITGELGDEELAVALVLVGRYVGLRKLILDTVDRMGEADLQSVKFTLRRMLDGQKQYGKLNVATDKRDFRVERAQEIADDLVYAHADILKRWAERGVI